MAQGTVKWFNSEKGYGFIAVDGGGGPDVFVHYSEILAQGYRSLEADQRVEFVVVIKGAREEPQASAVRLINGATGTITMTGTTTTTRTTTTTGTTTAPLRAFNPTSGDHFYTTSTAERDNAVAKGGYRDEGVACQVFPSQ